MLKEQNLDLSSKLIQKFMYSRWLKEQNLFFVNRFSFSDENVI